MNRKILTIVISALFILISAVHTEARLRWGATAGVNVSTVQLNQGLFPVGNVVGGTAGVVGEAIFPGIGIGVDLGLMYDMQGANIDLGARTVWSSEGYRRQNIYMHMLKIPVYLKLKYTRLNGLEDKIAPIVFGGPEFNIRLANTKCPALNYSAGGLGLAVGGGVELFRRWQVVFSYTWGISNSFGTVLLDDVKAQSRQWTVRLNYFF